ncbi:MAG TPA: DNA replication and repair protein RecF [Gaiellaceae bacterium]|nr:DNA replication and repair protein RecF [Gaiellaceae bacterium]
MTLRNYRSYASLDLALSPGIVVVAGENGTGKTNLLEALHLGTQGFSPRTRSDGQLIRFGENAAAVELVVRDGPTEALVRLVLQGRESRQVTVNGAPLPSAEALRRRFATVVFTPDRLAVVKGGPAVRRAYFDRVLGRLQPARLADPQDYAAALAQRNAALRRVQLGLSDSAAVAPWTASVADLGARLVESRRETIARISPGFAERAAELGLPDARLTYDATAPSVADLEARLGQDVARGATGLGPHLDEVVISAGPRELRSFGSQGEQRLAVLSLLLAEAELSPSAPLVLLDDVLSELDQRRRRVLAERIGNMEQAVITTTERSALPVEPAQVVEVSPGQAV